MNSEVHKTIDSWGFWFFVRTQRIFMKIILIFLPSSYSVCWNFLFARLFGPYRFLGINRYIETWSIAIFFPDWKMISFFSLIFALISIVVRFQMPHLQNMIIFVFVYRFSGCIFVQIFISKHGKIAPPWCENFKV